MVLTLAILSACSTGPSSPEDIPPVLFSKLDNSSAFFLQKDQLEGEQKKSAWQFVAIQALIAEGKFTLANPIIEYLQSQQLSLTEQASLTLLIADREYAQNNVDNAQHELNKIDSKQLSDSGFLYYLKLQLNLQLHKEDHLGAAHTLFSLTPLLKIDEEKQQYNDILLTQLVLLPSDFLDQYQTLLDVTAQTDSDTETLIKEGDTFTEGWYALAGIYQRYQLRPNQLKRSLENWAAVFATHPLREFMPTQLKDIPEFSPYQPENIAILLPLSGRFEKQGHAIQYGLLNAFYKQQKDNEKQKEAFPPAPKLHFYDSNAQTAEQIVAQFKTQNIDFVIGPLLKDKIQEFLPLLKNIPTLSLNNFPTQQSDNTAEEAANKQVAWHYAFPLSPEEEAKQAAQKIFADQHRKPLILAPNSAYGKRMVKAFNEQWLALNNEHNTPVEAHFFEDKAHLDKFIDNVLQTAKSKRRIKQMNAITDLHLQSEVRSRRDIDATYIISKRDELILLKPFIDVSISPFAQAMPLYASSRSHLNDRNGKQNKELDKLVFSDNPFLLNAKNKTIKEVQTILEKPSFATLRLFALGFDSYQLIEQLMQLQHIEKYTYQGLIGQLSLDESNTVQAKLTWATYKRGKTIEIIAPVSAE